MKKTILAVIIMLLAVLSMSYALAATEEHVTHIGDFEYWYTIKKDGTATILRVGRSSEFSDTFYFPEAVDGYTVTEIGNSSKSTFDTPESVFTWRDQVQNESSYSYDLNVDSFSSKILTIVIPNTVKRVGAYAFTNYHRLYIILPDSIEFIGDSAFENCINVKASNDLPNLNYIGDYAFYGCTDLERIKLPDTITHIGKNPFANCNNLHMIEINDSNPTLAFFDGVLFEKTTKRIISYLDSVAASEYVIPNGILTIGDAAFRGCNNLVNITIPSSVVDIKGSAFSFCSNLSAVNFNCNLVTIRQYVFSFCKNLTTIVIPESVIIIWDNAFVGCSNLNDMTITSKNTTLFPDALSGTAIAEGDGILHVIRDSCAHKYAVENDYNYDFYNETPNLDWLN